jgi:hypothetical protein
MLYDNYDKVEKARMLLQLCRINPHEADLLRLELNPGPVDAGPVDAGPPPGPVDAGPIDNDIVLYKQSNPKASLNEIANRFKVSKSFVYRLLKVS